MLSFVGDLAGHVARTMGLDKMLNDDSLFQGPPLPLQPAKDDTSAPTSETKKAASANVTGLTDTAHSSAFSSSPSEYKPMAISTEEFKRHEYIEVFGFDSRRPARFTYRQLKRVADEASDPSKPSLVKDWVTRLERAATDEKYLSQLSPIYGFNSDSLHFLHQALSGESLVPCPGWKAGMLPIHHALANAIGFEKIATQLDMLIKNMLQFNITVQTLLTEVLKLGPEIELVAGFIAGDDSLASKESMSKTVAAIIYDMMGIQWEGEFFGCVERINAKFKTVLLKRTPHEWINAVMNFIGSSNVKEQAGEWMSRAQAMIGMVGGEMGGGGSGGGHDDDNEEAPCGGLKSSRRMIEPESGDVGDDEPLSSMEIRDDIDDLLNTTATLVVATTTVVPPGTA